VANFDPNDATTAECKASEACTTFGKCTAVDGVQAHLFHAKADRLDRIRRQDRVVLGLVSVHSRDQDLELLRFRRARRRAPQRLDANQCASMPSRLPVTLGSAAVRTPPVGSFRLLARPTVTGIQPCPSPMFEEE
jgi:hypothetical protein